MDDGQNLDRFIQGFRDAFPYLDMERHPFSAITCGIGLLILMPMIASKLMGSLHSDDGHQRRIVDEGSRAGFTFSHEAGTSANVALLVTIVSAAWFALDYGMTYPVLSRNFYTVHNVSWVAVGISWLVTGFYAFADWKRWKGELPINEQ